MSTPCPPAGSIIKGLIIRAPWIDLILDGHKCWEMRKKATEQRGWIALIQSGTGAVQGVAQLVDCLPRISVADYNAHFAQHRVPADEVLPGDPYTVPWVMAHARRLAEPVPYRHRHRQGAVIWVGLEPQVGAAIERQRDRS